MEPGLEQRPGWDGRAPSLEAPGPYAPIDCTPTRWAGDWPTLLARLRRDADLDLVAAFARRPSAGASADFARRPSPRRFGRLRYAPLVSPPTRFDAWIDGDAQALRPAEVRGFRLFTGKAGCVLCHVGWRFTDDRFHDIGLPEQDAGRGAVPGGTPGLMAFKTPSLREVAHTAPYMHDGSLADARGRRRRTTPAASSGGPRWRPT